MLKINNRIFYETNFKEKDIIIDKKHTTLNGLQKIYSVGTHKEFAFSLELITEEEKKYLEDLIGQTFYLEVSGKKYQVMYITGLNFTKIRFNDENIYTVPLSLAEVI